MLRAATPLPTISAVLGHASEESTKQYMSIDDDRLLGVCCRCPKVHGRERPRVYQRVRRAAGRVRPLQAQHGIPRRVPDLVLEKFDAYCAEHALAVFDRETVEGWVTAQLATSGRYRSWMSYIRDFGRWLAPRGDTDAYVLSDKWKAPFVPARPYLLSKREVEAFFAAAARLDATSPWRWQARRILHADALVRDQDRRGPRPAGRTCRPARPARRRDVVQRQPQPPATDHR